MTIHLARRLLAAVLIALSALIIPACTVAEPAADLTYRLDAAVSEAFSAGGLPGAIVGLSIPGTVDYVRALGVSDTATSQPMSVDDFTRVGSVTKLFTGTAVLQLVDRGRIRLDDPISRYVEGVPAGDQITLDMLGRMRSGLYDYIADADFFVRYVTDARRGPDAAAFTPEDLLAVAFSHPLDFPPGAQVEYSNTNFVLLGLVVEKVTGQPFGEYLRQNIFDPLGLTQTRYPPNGLLPAPYTHGYFQPFAQGTVDTALWNPAVAQASGQIVSTFADLKAWLPAVARGALLSASTHANRLAQGGELAPGSSYTFAIANFNGWLGHDGEIPGYVTIALYLPQRDATLVIITNSSDDSLAPVRLATAVTSIVSPDHVYPAPA
jgi:D-alanyl-D-alanine carboxypeptidase